MVPVGFVLEGFSINLKRTPHGRKKKIAKREKGRYGELKQT